MPHSPEEKKKVLARIRRIRGQTEALERAPKFCTDLRTLMKLDARRKIVAKVFHCELGAQSFRMVRSR